MAITTGMLATDMNTTVITNVNAMATTYGLTGLTANVVTGQSMLGATITALYNNLVTCNNHANNKTKLDLSDITNYSIGTRINVSMVNLIETRALAVKATYCSCNCNHCSCDCARCSCNCNRCSCESQCYM